MTATGPGSNFEATLDRQPAGAGRNSHIDGQAASMRLLATLRFPELMSENHRALAAMHLVSVPESLRQQVLDVMDRKLAATRAGSEKLVSLGHYLQKLCAAARNGVLWPHEPAVVKAIPTAPIEPKPRIEDLSRQLRDADFQLRHWTRQCEVDGCEHDGDNVPARSFRYAKNQAERLRTELARWEVSSQSITSFESE